MFDSFGPFGQRAQHPQVITQFVQLTALAPEVIRGYLAGEAEDGRIRPKGRQEGRARIEHTGTRHHGIHAGAS